MHGVSGERSWVQDCKGHQVRISHPFEGSESAWGPSKRRTREGRRVLVEPCMHQLVMTIYVPMYTHFMLLSNALVAGHGPRSITKENACLPTARAALRNTSQFVGWTG